MCENITKMYPEGIDILINNAGENSNFIENLLIYDNIIILWIIVHWVEPHQLYMNLVPFLCP